MTVKKTKTTEAVMVTKSGTTITGTLMKAYDGGGDSDEDGHYGSCYG